MIHFCTSYDQLDINYDMKYKRVCLLGLSSLPEAENFDTFLCFFLSNVLSTGFLIFRFQFISRRFHFFSKESSEDFRFLWQNSCNDRRHKNTFTKQNSFFSETASPSIIPCGHKQHRRLRNINECARVCARVCESE